MNDYRENYFNPPHEDSPAEYKTGGDNYNSDLDRATEQEMVPDIVGVIQMPMCGSPGRTSFEVPLNYL